MQYSFSQNRTFLEWWWFFCTLLLTTFMIWQLDVFEKIWAADQTKISLAILSLFVVMTIYCGRQAWLLSKIQKNNLEIDETIKSKYESVWFSI